MKQGKDTKFKIWNLRDSDVPPNMTRHLQLKILLRQAVVTSNSILLIGGDILYPIF